MRGRDGSWGLSRKPANRLPTEELSLSRLARMSAPYNPRRPLTKFERESLKASLEAHGPADPLVCNRRSARAGWPKESRPIIVGGHKRVTAARELGWESFPVVWVDLDETRERTLNLALNKISGDFDPELEAAALFDLRELGLDDFDSAGYSLDEVKELLAGLEPAHGEIPPPIEPPKKARSRLGQIYKLGEHRLMCGDSLSLATREELLEAVTDYVTVLDPPFEMPAKSWAKLIGDPCILFGAVQQLRAVPDKLWRFERVLDKQTQHRMAASHIGYMHAYVIQLGTDKTCPRTKTTFPSIVRREDWSEHRHDKPAELIAEHLIHWTPPGPVFDPFAGSGSSFIAASLAGRVCYGVEIDPAQCDAIRERWSAFAASRSDGSRRPRGAKAARRKSPRRASDRPIPGASRPTA